MITKEQAAKLEEPIPASEIATRSAAGQSLSYVQGWWVIGELNRIFGPGGWSYEVETHEAVRTSEPDPKRGGERWRVSYRARCVLRVGDCVIADVGHGHGIDKDCGAAIESAEKEAATDALKRSAKSLGWRLGLALYDKDRQHVSHEPEEPAAPEPASESEIARIVRDWDAMPESERRAAWAGLDAAAKARVKAARAAKGAA